MKICLVDETGAGDGVLSVLASRWGLEHDDENVMALVLTASRLELRKRDEPKLGGIFVDFVGGAMALPKRSALRAATCRTWWMPRRAWGVMPLCWRL